MKVTDWKANSESNQPMKHEYDWSKLDAGWRFSPKAGALRYAALEHTNERGSVRYFAIDELEAWAFPSGLHTGNFITLWPEARAQLDKCRVIDNTPLFEAMDKMASEAESATQYDWSKLDAGWSVNGYTLRYSTEGELLYEIPVSKLESIAELDCGRHHPDSPLAQLAKCRVVDNTPLFEAMDKMASEAEPSPEYNWNKLEGTGWREGNGAYITNGKFNYWYTLGARPRLESITDKFHGNDALQAELSAEAAVEQCRHDAIDEVAEAIDGTGLQLHRVRGDVIMCIGNALNVDEHRRMRLLSTVTFDIDKLLALSLVIERLKKLGWRES